MTPKPRVEANEDMTDDNTLERVQLPGASVIQRLIADRDSLRNRVHVQQQDLVTLSAIKRMSEEDRGVLTAPQLRCPLIGT